MLEYSEELLEARLMRLTPIQRAAFALSCADRLWPYLLLIQSHATNSAARELSSRAGALRRVLRTAIAEEPAQRERVGAHVAAVEEYLPTDGDVRFESLGLETPYVQCAVAALLYCADVVLSGDVQAAVWAARQAYNVADQRAVRLLNVDFSEEGAERRLLHSELVQTEIRHQAEDLAQTGGGGTGSAGAERGQTPHEELDDPKPKK